MCNSNQIPISIIIPMHNNENTIGSCLNSFLNQGYSNLELICVDDYSSDLTVPICNSYAKRYSEVKVYLKKSEKHGVSEARNIGLSKAKGEIIGFSDADDEFCDNSLNIISRMFQDDPTVQVICGGYIRVVDKINKQKFSSRRKDNRIVNLLKLSEFALYKKYVGGYLWNKFFRKNIITHEKLNTDLRIGEDLNFIIGIGIKHPDAKVIITPSLIYKYNINNNSVTNSDSVDAYQMSKELITSLENCFMFISDSSLRIYRIISYKIYVIALDTKRTNNLKRKQEAFIRKRLRENKSNYFLMYYLEWKVNLVNYIKHGLSHIKVLRMIYKRITS